MKASNLFFCSFLYLFLTASSVLAQRTSDGALTDLCARREDIISSVGESNVDIREFGSSKLIVYETNAWKITCYISGETDKCYTVFQIPKLPSIIEYYINSILNKEGKIIREGKEWLIEDKDCPTRVTLVYNEKLGEQFFAFTLMRN